MKKTVSMLIVLGIFSTSAFAEFKKIPDNQENILLSKMKNAVFEHLQHLRETGEGNCFMPPSKNAVGIIFERDGKKYSNDFFLGKSGSSTMETSVYVDDQSSTTLITQSTIMNGNLMYIFTDSEKNVTGVRFVVDAGSSREVSIDCR